MKYFNFLNLQKKGISGMFICAFLINFLFILFLNPVSAIECAEGTIGLCDDAPEIEFNGTYVINTNFSTFSDIWLTVEGAIDDVSDIEQNFIDSSEFTNGSVLFSNGSKITEDNSAFFWDNAAKRLGIGTDTPSQTLEVVGNARFDRAGGTTVVIGGTLDKTYRLIVSEFGNANNGVTIESLGIANAARVYSANTGVALSLEALGGNIHLIPAAGKSTIINPNLLDSDTKILGDTEPNLFYGDAGNDRVGIKTATPQQDFNVDGTFNVTDESWFENNLHLRDLVKLFFGAADDISLLFDGVNFNITAEVGSPIFYFRSFAKYVFDNDVEITGNLNVSGNITSESSFISQYVFAHTNRTHPLVSASVWANVTFDQELSDIMFGITHVNDSTNRTFTFQDSGIYDIDYDYDVIDTSASSTDIDVAGRLIYSNGTEVIGSVFETDITKKDIEAEVSHDFLIRVGAGDSVVFQFIADDVDVKISTHGTFGLHPESASVRIMKVAN